MHVLINDMYNVMQFNVGNNLISVGGKTYIVSPNIDFLLLEFSRTTILCTFNPGPSSNYLNIRTTGAGAVSIRPIRSTISMHAAL